MSVSPVNYNGMLQRTDDVSSIKRNEDVKPAVQQHNVQTQQLKQEHALTHTVLKSNQKENEQKRYDAREKGNGSYQKQEQQKKKKLEKKPAEDKVIIKEKGQSSGFDIKI